MSRPSNHVADGNGAVRAGRWRGRHAAIPVLIAYLVLILAQPADAQTQTGMQPARNILWDGGFDLGYGNNCWAAAAGNRGPNRRADWRDGVLVLRQEVASRLYWLEDGPYALCAWVRRDDTNAGVTEASVSLMLSNNNDYGTQPGNTFRRVFAVPVSNGWQRVGWTFEVRAPISPNFHVEIKPVGEGAVLVDAVSLTSGAALPVSVRPAADVEAGFFVADETGIYTDGEPRSVDLVIRNHGDATFAKVAWEIFDSREQLVRSGAVAETLPAGTTVRRPLPVADLPWNGYRFACSAAGQPVVGDALAAFLPRIPQDAFMQYGGDASVNPWAADFTGAFMRKLGMQMATVLSPGGIVGRWSLVEPEPGRYVWQDEAVDAVRSAGIDVVGFLGMKYVPKWLLDKARPRGKDLDIIDEAAYTQAYCRYVDAFVRHYAGRIQVVHLEDEIHTTFATPEQLQQLKRIYLAARATAKCAARECGSTITVGFNGSIPAWWEQVIDTIGVTNLAFISQNSNLRPQWTADTLNLARRKGFFPPVMYTVGVGQRSLMRQVSLPQDRTTSAGNPPGLFAWQMMLHQWLSRPYGTEDPRDGPLIRYGYYDLRALGQCIFYPSAGKTCIEYDNSPTLGIQAMAMLKWFLAGQRAVRSPSEPFGIEGLPLATTNTPLRAYPFRDSRNATIVLTTRDASSLAATWRLAGLDFLALNPVDLYNRPLAVADGVATAHGLPVFLRAIPAGSLEAALAACGALAAEIVPAPEQVRVAAGPFVLDVDPGRPGVLQLSHIRNGNETVLIDRVICTPALPRPTISVTRGRTESTVTLMFGGSNLTRGDAHRLGITLTESGVTFQWRKRNARREPECETVRFRLNPAGAGREIVIQEGSRVRAGKLREDYGHLFPAATLPPLRPLDANAAWVSIHDFATFDLPAASGRGSTPATGLRWSLSDGEAWIEAGYVIGPYQGGGSRGVQHQELSMTVTAP